MKLFTIKKDRIVPFAFQWFEEIGELLYSDGRAFYPIKIEDKYKEKINDYLMCNRKYFNLDRVMEFIEFFSRKTSPEIAICTAFNDFIPFEMIWSYDEYIRTELSDFIDSNENYTELEKEWLIDSILQTVNKEGFVRFWTRKHLKGDKLEILPNASNNGFWVYNPIID